MRRGLCVVLTMLTILLLLLVCSFFASAQDGGCSPDPPNTLMPSHPTHLLSNNVPQILPGGSTVTFRPVIGGYGSDPWTVFSESQVMQFGLWCQVRQVNTNNKKVLIKKLKSVGMTLAKVKEQDGMMLAKVKEQDGKK